jgi:tetratricopeptide (TPR) repeat protein
MRITGGCELAEAKSPWDHIRYGNAERGLELLRENYARKASASHIMELGVAYLWVGDYERAGEHFRHAIQTHPRTLASFHGMAGVAGWCRNKPDEAVTYWRAGLNAQFADSAGGLHIPLLLWVASVLVPSILRKKEAEEILKQRVRDAEVDRWPGPLAQFVLGRVDEESLRGLSRGKTEINTQRRRWLSGFYRGLVDVERGNLGALELKELLQQVSDSSQPEWSNEQQFLSLPWSEEFFIARHGIPVVS